MSKKKRKWPQQEVRQQNGQQQQGQQHKEQLKKKKRLKFDKNTNNNEQEYSSIQDDYIKSNKIFRCILALITIVIYFNSLNGGFTYDDRRAILENRNVMTNVDYSNNNYGFLPTWLIQSFKDDFWGTPMHNVGSHKSYRPLVTLTYRFQRQLNLLFVSKQQGSILTNDDDNAQQNNSAPDGELENAFAYHLVNLLLHLIVVDLVFQISTTIKRTLSQTKITTNEQRKKNSLESVACITALLFACHPVHVEAVTSLVGRAEIMGALFALLSFKNMLNYLFDSNEKSSSIKFLLKSATLAGFACLSKENCATVIFINILLVGWLLLSMNRGNTTEKEKNIIKAKRAFVTMLSVLIAFLGLRIQLNMSPSGNEANNLSSILPKFSHLDNPLAQSPREFCLHEQNTIKQHELQSFTIITGDGFSLSSSSSNKHEQLEAKLQQTTREALCSDQKVLNNIERLMFATRFYLPPYILFKLLICPIELSYDWPLASIGGGLIKSILELRFLFAMLVYITLVLFTLKWFQKKTYNNNFPLEYSSIIPHIKNECLSWLNLFSTIKLTNNNNDNESSSSSSSSSSSTFISCKSTDTIEKYLYNDSDTSISSNYGRRSEPEVDSANEEEEDEFGSETSSIKSVSTIKSSDSGFASSVGSHITANETNTNKKFYKKKLFKRSLLIKPSTKTNKEKQQMDFIAWALVWLVVPYLPASNIFFSVGFLIAERTLYLPSFGFCLMMGFLLNHLASNLLKTSAIIKLSNKLKIYFEFLLLRIREEEEEVEEHRKKMTIITSTSNNGVSSKKSMKSLMINLVWFKQLVFNLVRTTRYRSADENNKQKLTAKLLLISPLLIFGAYKTVNRNEDWFNETSLYSSNLHQSPAKSMVNLASIEALTNLAISRKQHEKEKSEKVEDSLFDYNQKRIESLYREALSNEPSSADLHYNLALALQRKQNNLEIDKKQIEYHYKFALKLRKNFPLAALNLGAYQYNELNQFDEATESFQLCAFKMNPYKSKTFKTHIQTQMECLISESKMLLDHRVLSITSDKSSFKNKCLKILHLTDVALKKAKELYAIIDSEDISTTFIEENNLQQLEGVADFGDLNKQLATINYIKAQCIDNTDIRFKLLEKGVEFSKRSKVSIGNADLYTSYVDLLFDTTTDKNNLSSDSNKVENAIAFLNSVIKLEHTKGAGNNVVKGKQLAKLHQKLAQIYERHTKKYQDAMKQMELALQYEPYDVNFLSFAAHLAYKLGQFKRSEKLYLDALERQVYLIKVGDNNNNKHEAEAKDNKEVSNNRKLGTAHANYGAILQVNGHSNLALEQYRKALDFDSSNTIAATNLSKLLQKESKAKRRNRTKI